MKKLLTLLLCLMVGIGSIRAGNIASGSVGNAGTWAISDKGELYIDVANVPSYGTTGVDSRARDYSRVLN